MAKPTDQMKEQDTPATVTKLEGFVDPQEAIDFHDDGTMALSTEEHPNYAPATLFIGPGKFFTEAEVRAMLLSIDEAIMSDRAQMAIKHHAAKVGIIIK